MTALAGIILILVILAFFGDEVWTTLGVGAAVLFVCASCAAFLIGAVYVFSAL